MTPLDTMRVDIKAAWTAYRADQDAAEDAYRAALADADAAYAANRAAIGAVFASAHAKYSAAKFGATKATPMTPREILIADLAAATAAHQAARVDYDTTAAAYDTANLARLNTRDAHRLASQAVTAHDQAACAVARAKYDAAKATPMTPLDTLLADRSAATTAYNAASKAGVATIDALDAYRTALHAAYAKYDAAKDAP